MVIKEAIACKTPIVSVDVGDVKELIEDIPGSYVVKRKSAKIISDKIKKSLFHDESKKSDFSVKAIDLEHINEKLIVTYKNLIKDYFNN